MKKQWWENRYGTKKGVDGYFNTYKEILNDSISKQEVITMVSFLKSNEIPLNGETLILDGFCGNCRHTKQLIKMGLKNITAFDYSEEMLKMAKENLNSNVSKISLSKEDGRQLSFSSNLFNFYYVLGNSAFGFFDDPKDDLKVAKEAYRVLKAGGVFVFDLVDYNYVVKQLTDHNFESWEGNVRVVRQRKTFQHNGLLRTGHKEIRYYQNKTDCQIIGRWVYKNEQIINLLRKAGFSNINIKNEAFCYDKNSDRYGTMGVRNLYLVKK